MVILEALYTMTSLHGLSVNGCFYFCHPTPLYFFFTVHQESSWFVVLRHNVTLTFTQCSADKMQYCSSLLTITLYDLHEDFFRFNCGQAVMKPELHCIAESL